MAILVDNNLSNNNQSGFRIETLVYTHIPPKAVLCHYTRQAPSDSF